MSPEDLAPLMVAPFRLDSLHELPPPAPGEHPKNGHGAHAPPPRRRRWGLVSLLVLLLLVAGAGAYVGVRLAAPDTPPTQTTALAESVPVPDEDVSLPWPQTGTGAVAIPALGVTETSGPEQPVSVASLTKLVTAYVILRDHPLAVGEPGPTVTVTPADVTDYDQDAAQDNSSALVTAGEQLTEAQLLGGLLVHSADNYADVLATWDAGSIPAFVAKMNAAAAELGMTQSHFADASGVSPQSVSTASDILKVAALDMRNPVVAADVRQPSITLPVAGTISSFTPLVGLDGVIGVKSGFSTTAGGCDVLGVVRQIGGQQVLLLAAVTGQTGQKVLAQAGLHALALVNAMEPHVRAATVLRRGELVAHVGEGGRTVPARATATASVLTWPGLTAHRLYRRAHDVTDQARRGDHVGTVVVTLGKQRVLVPVQLSRDVPRETLLQRLF